MSRLETEFRDASLLVPANMGGGPVNHREHRLVNYHQVCFTFVSVKRYNENDEALILRSIFAYPVQQLTSSQN